MLNQAIEAMSRPVTTRALSCTQCVKVGAGKCRAAAAQDLLANFSGASAGALAAAS